MSWLSTEIHRRAWLPACLLALALGLVLVWSPQGTGRSDEARSDDPDHRLLPLGGSEDQELMKQAKEPSKVAEGSGVAEPDFVSAPNGSPVSDGKGIALREMMRWDSAGLEEIQREDGGASISLQGRFMHMSGVVMGSDGEQRIQCFSSAEDLVASVTASIGDSSMDDRK